MLLTILADNSKEIVTILISLTVSGILVFVTRFAHVLIPTSEERTTREVEFRDDLIERLQNVEAELQEMRTKLNESQANYYKAKQEILELRFANQQLRLQLEALTRQVNGREALG